MVMVVLPYPFGVITPLEEIVATDLEELLYVSFPFPFVLAPRGTGLLLMAMVLFAAVMI